MSEYLTKQHPPFYVSDERAIDVLCNQFGIKSLSDLHETSDQPTTERRVISVYVLSLYTGLKIEQACKMLNMQYNTAHYRIGDLKDKIRDYPKSNTAKTLNNIIKDL